MIKIINVYKDSRVMEMTSSSNLGLGVRTDNDVDLLRFTFDEMIVGTATLLTSLTDDNGDLVAFPLTLNQENNSYDLEITNYVASQTNYTIQVEIVNDDMIWHSKQADIILDECLEVGEGEMPTTIDNWLQNANLVMSGYADQMIEWGQEVEQAVSSAENVNIEVEEGENLYNVTITDRDGVEHEAIIYQGANAIISGATASVDNQVGTPSVNVTMGGTESDRTFDFAFHNLKGEKGDKGDKGDAGAIKFEIVQELPTTGIEEDTIYLVPITPDESDNNYEEYIYVNGQWELLGRIGVHVDLSDYYTKSETDSLLNNKVDTTTFNTSQQAQDTLIANKVNTTTYNQGQATQDTKITNLENQVFGDETIEGEGTSLTLDGTLKGQFNSIGLKGNTSQEGTPTPTSPIPVNVVSGDNSIIINGKNWFDKDNTQWNRDNASTYDIGGTSGTNTARIRTSSFRIQGGKTYTISGIPSGISLTSVRTYTVPSGESIGSATRNGDTFTLNDNVNYIHLLFNGENFTSATNTLMANANIMLNEGSSALSYEPYQGNTYNIDLPVENLFNKDGTNILNGYINGSTISPYAGNRTVYIPVKQGETYTMNKTVGSAGLIYAYCVNEPTINGTTLGQTTSSLKTITTTASANANYLAITIYRDVDSSYTVEEVLGGLQIEKGTKANTYTPYGTTPIELCKIGNYQDYFYKDSDKWYLHKEIGKVVLNGSESDWTYNQTTNYYRYFLNSDINLKEPESSSADLRAKIFSNKFIAATPSETWGGKTGINTVYPTSTYNFTRLCLCYVSSDTNTSTKFKAWLAENNVPVYYPLQVPTNTEITYQPLIDQLNGLEKAQSKENQTNISQVNNDLPFIISASAFLNNINGKIALLNKLTEV